VPRHSENRFVVHVVDFEGRRVRLVLITQNVQHLRWRGGDIEDIEASFGVRHELERARRFHR